MSAVSPPAPQVVNLVRRGSGAPRGRQPTPEDRATVATALGDLPARRDLLLEALHRLQDTHRALLPGHLAALAERFRLAQVEVYEVASFYHHFDVLREGETPPPPVTIRVCGAPACDMAGAQALREALACLPADRVRVLEAPCLGRCDAAPAVLVNREALTPATVASVAAVVNTIPAGVGGPCYADPPAVTTTSGVASAAPHGSVTAAHLPAALARGAYAHLRALHDGTLSSEAVLETLDGAQLRGLGGAGFPTARKWRAVRDEPAPRLMAVNADESEPGTFKDRHLLETDVHRVLEGMFIAAHVVGASAIHIYLRDEYTHLHALLARELGALRATPPAPGLPPVELRRGAGAYVCGEESALIESLEGKRGLPRLRPPYVAQRGLFGRPTLVNNVETLWFLPFVLARGPEAFADPGRNGRRGLRHFSLSGRVNRPGVHLAPAGISVRELIDEFGGGMPPGHELRAFLPGGASGGMLPATLAHLPLDFDTLQPHGAFIGSAAITVLSQHDSPRQVTTNLMRFFADESCGQCTPCRAGTVQALRLMQADTWDAATLGRLSRTMRDASICGLGQAAPNTFDSVLAHFPDEVRP